jgi:hypothetical protein
MSVLWVLALFLCCMSKVPVNATYPFCFFILHVRTNVYAACRCRCPCRMPISMLHSRAGVLAACQCCISMLHVHVHAACLWNGNLHVHAVRQCCWSMLHVATAYTLCPIMSVLHVRAAFLCCMSTLHVSAACPCCRCCTSVLSACPVYAACLWCMSMLQVNASSLRCIYKLAVHVARPYCVYAYAAWPCRMSILHIHVSCPCLCSCCMSMLHVHASFSWFMSMLHTAFPCYRYEAADHVCSQRYYTVYIQMGSPVRLLKFYSCRMIQYILYLHPLCSYFHGFLCVGSAPRSTAKLKELCYDNC